jgi:hypothetical protein
VVVSGTPDLAQSGASFSVRVTDATVQSARESYTLNVVKTQNAQLQILLRPVASGVVEVQGTGTGQFNPGYWQSNTLNWVPDVRLPFLLAQTTGPYRNIYAPWVLEQPSDWRIFYGGWDGSNTPNDRVYSVNTTDFVTLTNRMLVIDHGDFEHVNNESVQRLADGSLHMIATSFPDQAGLNKPAYFSSPDRSVWNGSPEPYQAKLTDIISIPNYALFSGAEINGASVLFYDNDLFTLFFQNNNDQSLLGTMYRATSSQPPVFTNQGLALATASTVQDVRKLQVDGKNWYVMGLASTPQVSFSLSNDGVNFRQEQVAFGPAYLPSDTVFVTMCFVTRGNTLLGVLYGGTDRPFGPGSIYARWLQKKIVIEDSFGNQIIATGSLGPDRQQFTLSSRSVHGTIWIYAENGLTPLAAGQFNIVAGNAYQLVLN